MHVKLIIASFYLNFWFRPCKHFDKIYRRHLNQLIKRRDNVKPRDEVALHINLPYVYVPEISSWQRIECSSHLEEYTESKNTICEIPKYIDTYHFLLARGWTRLLSCRIHLNRRLPVLVETPGLETLFTAHSIRDSPLYFLFYLLSGSLFF